MKWKIKFMFQTTNQNLYIDCWSISSIPFFHDEFLSAYFDERNQT